MDTKWCHPNICIGTGKYPRCDPWGRPFTAQYHPHRMRLAGKRIAGNYVGVLEAFQGDQDFIRILFSPSRCIAAFLGNYKYVGFIRFAPHHYIADFPKKKVLITRLCNLGFFSRQFCCYYCRACQWVYQDDNPQLNDYLYTNFGPAAAHRNTNPDVQIGIFFEFLFSTQFFCNVFLGKDTVPTNSSYEIMGAFLVFEIPNV